MPSMTIDSAERDLLVQGLQMRICHIETGTPIMRATDAIAQGKQKLVQPLRSSQYEVINQSEALIKKLLSAH